MLDTLQKQLETAASEYSLQLKRSTDVHMAWNYRFVNETNASTSTSPSTSTGTGNAAAKEWIGLRIGMETGYADDGSGLFG